MESLTIVQSTETTKDNGNLNHMFEYNISSPPSDQQFQTISRYLQTKLQDANGIVFEVTHTQYEQSSWITLQLRADSLIENFIDLAFVGVLSYSLRAGLPSIQSVLLAFSGGKRLCMGRQSILKSSFVLDEDGGHWEKFKWSVDEYGEWECDDLPTLPSRSSTEA